MIAVAGPNTAIEKLVEVETLAPGQVMRAHHSSVWPGGKGAHAAMCVAVLGERVRLVGLTDGATGEWFNGWLANQGVEFDGVDGSVAVRTCLTFFEASGRITEIREAGSRIQPDVWPRYAARVVDAMQAAGVCVLSGSVPPGAPPDAYRDLVTRAPIPVVVDASGELLRTATDAAPFAIKPNREEAEALARAACDSPAAAARVARALVAATGIRLVVISLAAAGAVACWDGRVCRIEPPPVVARNAVGAGDCVTGAVAVGISRQDDMENVLRLAVASGTAKVLSPEIGIVRAADIDNILAATQLTWFT